METATATTPEAVPAPPPGTPPMSVGFSGPLPLPIPTQAPSMGFSIHPPVQSGGESLLGPQPASPQPGQPLPPPPPAEYPSELGASLASPTTSPLTPAPPILSPEEPIPPNRTLYVNNLNTKIKLDQLVKELRAIFENFGVIREVIAMSSFWRRGQAWIVLADQDSADKALSQLQGFPYCGKELRIQYAREVSDIIAKEEGTFVKRPPGPKKPRAIIEKEKKLQAQLQQFQQMMMAHFQNQTSQQTEQQASGIGLTQEAQPNPRLPMHIAPQFASMMLSQVPLNLQAGIQGGALPELQQSAAAAAAAMQGKKSTATQGVSSPAAVGASSISVKHETGKAHGQQPIPTQQQPHFQQFGITPGGPAVPPPPHVTTPGLDMRAVPPPTPGGLMHKDALVAAAAAAAAQAVEAAAKKRALESESKSPLNKMPRMAIGEGGPLRFRSGFAPPVDNSVAAAAAAAAVLSSQMTGGGQGFSRPTGIAPIPAAPNKTLFVENLPEDCDIKMLDMVFKQYPGCGEIRHVSSRRVAFVDYENLGQASVALRYLHNFPIKEGYNIRMSYAR